MILYNSLDRQNFDVEFQLEIYLGENVSQSILWSTGNRTKLVSDH